MRIKRSLGTSILLILTSAIWACDDGTGPVLDPSDLSGEWGYRIVSAVGGGVSCTSRPTTGWAIPTGTAASTQNYAFSVEGITLICSNNGAAPDTATFYAGPQDRIVHLSLATGDSGIKACLLPGYAYAETVGGNMIFHTESDGCADLASNEGVILTFTPPMLLSYGADTLKALATTIRLERR